MDMPRLLEGSWAEIAGSPLAPRIRTFLFVADVDGDGYYLSSHHLADNPTDHEEVVVRIQHGPLSLNTPTFLGRARFRAGGSASLLIGDDKEEGPAEVELPVYQYA